MATGPISLESLEGGIAAPPVLLLSDLLTEATILKQQEDDDRNSLAALLTPNLQLFREKLVPWIAGGYQGNCDLIRISLAVPNVCSDGVVRNLHEYIAFLSGKTLDGHLASLEPILPDFQLRYILSREFIVYCATGRKTS